MGLFSGLGGIGPYMNYESLGATAGKAGAAGVSSGASTTAASGTAKPNAANLPTQPDTIQADLDKLDKHLPKADPNKPYTNEDVANVLRDPDTGLPVHVDGKPASADELQALTVLSNHPDKREAFFANYRKQYDAAVAASESQAKEQIVANILKAIPQLGKDMVLLGLAVDKERRERDQIDQIVPKVQKKIADRPMQPGRSD